MNREWQEMALLDLVTIRSGQVDPREAPYRDMPLIAPDHIASATGRLIRSESASAQGAISGKYLVQPGDVVYSKIRPYLRKAYKSNSAALCSADMYPLTPQTGVDSSFVLHTVLGDDFTNYAVSVSARSGIPKINRDEFAGFRLLVPPLSEQRAIGVALDDADALIGAIERMVAKKEALRAAMEEQLLTGRVRLREFVNPWDERTLGDVARIRTGSRNNQDKTAGGRYPFFVRSASVERIDTFSFDCEAILVPGEGNIGSIFHYVNGKFEVHQRVYKISDFARDAHGRFIYHYLRRFFGAHALENSVKATVDSLRLPTFRNFRLLMPSLSEQIAIAGSLDSVETEIASLNKRLRKARAVKMGMAQQLLKGRVRLSEEAVA